MKTFYLRRIIKGESATWGALLDQRETPFALTGELPWKNNQRNVSCIPAGSYLCYKRISPKRGLVFQFRRVPQRSSIQIHCGNIPVKDSKGCILVGEEFSCLDKTCAVLSSRRAFQEFLSKLGEDSSFRLIILEAPVWEAK